jgi:hypothetical protein
MRLRPIPLSPFCAFLFLACTFCADALAAEYQMSRAPNRRMVIMPQLEVKLLSGDFERWGSEKVIYQPETLELHWGSPLSPDSATWQLATDPFPTNNIVSHGAIPPLSSAGAKWSYFKLNLAGLIPDVPPADGSLDYYVRVFPKGTGAVQTGTIRLVYMRDKSSTRFTAAGLYPELFRPMPVFVELQNFHILKADEEDDEEPYIVPVVLFMDGTTLNVLDLANSSVRVATSQRADTHGNIPQYNSSIGSGDDISIPEDVGRFESEILPINIAMADDPLLEAMFGFRVDYSQLTKATTVWVAVMAMEEDATSTEAANAARDAFMEGLRAELNGCIQSLTLTDAIRLVKNGQTMKDLLKADDAELCGYVATEDSSILDQIRAKLKALAKDAATGEELDDALNWFPGGVTNLLDNVADHDDVIAFGYKSFTYDQLWRAERPVGFTLDLHLLKRGKYPDAGTRNVHYEVKGSIGRCQHVPNKTRCVPVIDMSRIQQR